ncbi:hypothetical protein ACWDZ6_29075 [Streptomyces sp. NPDC002926]
MRVGRTSAGTLRAPLIPPAAARRHRCTYRRRRPEVPQDSAQERHELLKALLARDEGAVHTVVTPYLAHVHTVVTRHLAHVRAVVTRHLAHVRAVVTRHLAHVRDLWAK